MDYDTGYFVDSEDEMDLEIDIEDRARYTTTDKPYCPVYIGQLLDSRYCIEHKLGHGTFSTVWLAYDQQDKRSVALKILTCGTIGNNEQRMHDAIIESGHDTSRLVICIRYFRMPGPSGSHLVFVFPVRGPNLDDLCFKVPHPLRIGAAKDLLMALATLHHAGFVHNDINGGSVMWHIDPIDHWTLADKYQQFGRPRKIAIAIQGKPGELVSPASIPPGLVKRPVYLGDFGLSFDQQCPPPSSIQGPLRYCAPERLHGHASSCASDMWSYMVVFTSLYLGHSAIRGEGRRVIWSIVCKLGPFPVSWRGCYTGVGPGDDWWYDHSGQTERPSYAIVETLADDIAYMRPDVSQIERDHVLHIMRRGFCYEPQSRITADELLQDPSFQYIMSIYGA